MMARTYGSLPTQRPHTLLAVARPLLAPSFMKRIPGDITGVNGDDTRVIRRRLGASKVTSKVVGPECCASASLFN